MSFFDEADIEAQAKVDADTADSDSFELVEGEVLKGIVLSAKTTTTRYGLALVLIVRNVGDKPAGGIEAGESGTLWCSTVLERKMLEAAPKKGTGIILRYEGKVTPKKGGNPYKSYTLLAEESAPEAYATFAIQLAEAKSVSVQKATPTADSGDWF